MSDRPDPASVLDAILARTRERVAAEQERRPLGFSHPAVTRASPVRPFSEALARSGRVNVIAEHKRRSPSRGAIREDLAPADVARRYESAGAAAISVLTDEPFFGGRMDHLVQAREAVALPVLRKDFVLDPWQVWEARAAGADAVLLIVAALTDAELRGLLGVAREAGLDALVEVHDRPELDRALAAGSRIVGVNNRDLKTLAVSLQTSLALAPVIPDDVVAVAESGIRTSADLVRLRDAGFDAFLVGERLMSAPDPGEALKRLLEGAS
jgi:indole-3-glycerol phosphate synthase